MVLFDSVKCGSYIIININDTADFKSPTLSRRHKSTTLSISCNLLPLYNVTVVKIALQRVRSLAVITVYKQNTGFSLAARA